MLLVDIVSKKMLKSLTSQQILCLVVWGHWFSECDFLMERTTEFMKLIIQFAGSSRLLRECIMVMHCTHVNIACQCSTELWLYHDVVGLSFRKSFVSQNLTDDTRGCMLCWLLNVYCRNPTNIPPYIKGLTSLHWLKYIYFFITHISNFFFLSSSFASGIPLRWNPG